MRLSRSASDITWLNHWRYSTTSFWASEIIRSPSRRAARASAVTSRRFSSKRASASAVAWESISCASLSAALMYLRPRDSAPDKSARALLSAASSASRAVLLASLTTRSEDENAFCSRACADLIMVMAVSVAKISNSSLLSDVMSRRERRSDNCASSSRIRSTEFCVVVSPSLKPTQLRKVPFSFAMTLD